MNLSLLLINKLHVSLIFFSSFKKVVSCAIFAVSSYKSSGDIKQQRDLCNSVS